MIVCVCKAVSDKVIRELVAQGHTSMKPISKHCKAGSDCGACVQSLKKLINESKNAQTCAK